MSHQYKREKDLIPHYDNHLEYYSPLQEGSYFKYMCDELGVDLNKINSVLDLGCGDGRLCGSISPETYYMGVDYSQKRIEKATNNYPERNFQVSCVHHLCDNQVRDYDLVVITEVLEHIESPYTVIKQLLSYNKATQIIATVPIDLPYVAHLSVWKTEEDVKKDLDPDVIKVDKQHGAKHFLCGWGV
tara:strand:- start:65 stop:625 length:561 start_codon:yes stop_codon:yes gene_type:complete